MKKPKSLCYMPWAGVSNNPDGTVRPCCLYRDTIKDNDGNDMYVQEHSLKDLFASDYMKNVNLSLVPTSTYGAFANHTLTKNDCTHYNYDRAFRGVRVISQSSGAR